MEGEPGCIGGAPNGTHEMLEECDDGNTTNGDGCSEYCRLEYCGNAWLDPGVFQADQLQDLLEPYAGSDLESFPVSTLVNSPANDVPECLRPIETQGSLFQ